ncbi:MAG: ISKra4 family transposase [Bryobacteraceae bacterium]
MPQCHRAPNPTDAALGVERQEFSPGVRRMMAVVGSDAAFEVGREQLELLAGLSVSTKSVERQAEQIGAEIIRLEQAEIQRGLQLDLPMPLGPPIPVIYVEIDGTGAPVVRKETQGRIGKLEGQPAHTREVKLGCVFTSVGIDRENRPIHDAASTTYTGAIETAEEFACRIYREAYQRGWSRARIQVVLGDGAIWIWNIAAEQFPGAILIVDFYHACEHLHKLSRLLFPSDEAARRGWTTSAVDLLDKGGIELLVALIRGLAGERPELAEKLGIEAEYFERNAAKMRYPDFRAQGLFVGSGVIEAGCKTVIGSRLKQSGMFWTVQGANRIIALRCCRISGRFEDFWEQAHAA